VRLLHEIRVPPNGADDNNDSKSFAGSTTSPFHTDVHEPAVLIESKERFNSVTTSYRSTKSRNLIDRARQFSFSPTMHYAPSTIPKQQPTKKNDDDKNDGNDNDDDNAGSTPVDQPLLSFVAQIHVARIVDKLLPGSDERYPLTLTVEFDGSTERVSRDTIMRFMRAIKQSGKLASGVTATAAMSSSAPAWRTNQRRVAAWRRLLAPLCALARLERGDDRLLAATALQLVSLALPLMAPTSGARFSLYTAELQRERAWLAPAMRDGAVVEQLVPLGHDHHAALLATLLQRLLELDHVACPLSRSDANNDGGDDDNNDDDDDDDDDDGSDGSSKLIPLFAVPTTKKLADERRALLDLLLPLNDFTAHLRPHITVAAQNVLLQWISDAQTRHASPTTPTTTSTLFSEAVVPRPAAAPPAFDIAADLEQRLAIYCTWLARAHKLAELVNIGC
jgi:hypothetical protein